jgi:6-phosphofructokinase 1
MIVEVMGRDAGWLALHSGIAGGADIVLIPELPFSLDAVQGKISSRERSGSKFSIIVAAEGAKPIGGEQIYQTCHDPSSPRRLGGIGAWVGREISAVLDREVRTTVLGHIQRGGSPSAFDRTLGTFFGVEAVGLISRRRWGQMVALQGRDIVSVPIADAVRELKTVPLNGHQVRSARALGLCVGDG